LQPFGNGRVGLGAIAHVGIDRWSQRQEAGKTAAKNMIQAAAVAENVLPHGFAAVILELMIGLVSLLGRQKAWSGAEIVCARSQAIGIAADGQFYAGQRVEDRRSRNCIDNAVAELGVTETNAVGEAAGDKVQPTACTGVWFTLPKG
jgi:hypothetical protein